jgi:hypothetical protein
MSYDQAFAAAERAVGAERAHNSQAALVHYVEARRLFAAVASTEKDPKAAGLVRAKVAEFDQTIAKLRTAASGGGGGLGGGGGGGAGGGIGGGGIGGGGGAALLDLPDAPSTPLDLPDPPSAPPQRASVGPRQRAEHADDAAAAEDRRGNHAAALQHYERAAEEYLAVLKGGGGGGGVGGGGGGGGGGAAGGSGAALSEADRRLFSARVVSILDRLEQLKKGPRGAAAGGGGAPASAAVGGGAAAGGARAAAAGGGSGGGQQFSAAELDVLRRSSYVNGRIFQPWLANEERTENFSFPDESAPFVDNQGQLPLSPSQKKHCAGWRRAPDVVAMAVGGAASPAMIRAVSPDRVQQELVTDCSFVASLIIAAAFEQRFRKQLITAVIYPQVLTGAFSFVYLRTTYSSTPCCCSSLPSSNRRTRAASPCTTRGASTW